MSATVSPGKLLAQRLMPLYVAAFFQGFVLWYTLEKLFMHTIGFDDTGIGLMVSLYSAIMLLIETPSSVLADRWSRKGMLIVGSIALALSSVICGLSHGIPMYLVGAALWGVFYALYSGMYDSIVYDLLFELRCDNKLFERYYGRVKAVDSVALVLGSVLGGVVAGEFGMRAAYMATVPLTLLAVGALLVFKEPLLHKVHAASSVKAHVRATLQAMRQKGQLLPVAGVLVVIGSMSVLIFEFNQLWLIALAVPLVFFGTANALMLSTSGIGGIAADYLQMHRHMVMRLTIVVMLVSSVGLLVFRSAPAIVTCQVLLGVGLVGLDVVFSRLLHDLLPSQVRASASSAVSTVSRLVIIPLAWLFGYISKRFDIYHSSWVFIAMLGVATLFMVKLFADRTPIAPVAADDAAAAEEYQK